MFRFKRRWSIVPAAGLLGLLTTAAFAFFLTTYIADGTHEGKTASHGNGALPLQISFAEGQLAPGVPVEVTAKLENTSGRALTFHKLKLTVETPSVPKCGTEWLKFREEGGTEPAIWEEIVAGTNSAGSTIPPIPAGTSPVLTNGGKLLLEFNPAKNTVDESSCENVAVIVKGHLE